MTIGEELDKLRKRAGLTMQDLAREMGYARQSSIQRYLAPDYNLPLRWDFLMRLEAALDGKGRPKIKSEDFDVVKPPPVTFKLPPLRPRPYAEALPSVTIPLYGQAMGGADGRFEFNGQKISDILAPPMLIGVPDSYAVLIVGESMEPRYFAGETAYVHPRLPVRRDDFVIVQIRSKQDGDAPEGYVKQFISKSEKVVKLRQLNPPRGASEDLTFDTDRVLAIHKIILSGTGSL